MKVKIVKPSRLNGMDLAPGEEVEIPDSLAETWFLADRAKRVAGRPKKADLSESAHPKGKKKKSLEKAVKKPSEKAVKFPEPEAAGEPKEV